MKPTLYDISRRAGVSIATVSRVINNNPLVKEATRQRVLKAMADAAYHPSHAARALAGQRTRTLAAILPDIDTGFYANTLRGIYQATLDTNYHLVTAFSRLCQDQQALVESFVMGRRADAMVLMNLGPRHGLTPESLPAELPIVLLDAPMAGVSLPCVELDNQGGAAAALNHLLEPETRHLAILGGPADTHDADQRLQGCYEALKEQPGRSLELTVRMGDFTEASGRRFVEEWLASGKALPDALFAHNDLMAIGAMAALREHGYSVPGDVRIVGFDDVDSAGHLGLSSVHVPMQEMGRLAGQLAIAALDQDEPAPSRVLPTELIVRTSSQPA